MICLIPMMIHCWARKVNREAMTGNLHADQMFLATAEAKGERLDPVKHV